MESSAISISVPNDPWKARFAEFPVGLVEACLWLAAVYALPWGVAELLKATNTTLPESLPASAPQIALMSLLALAFLIYWRVGRKARLGALGISASRLGGDLAFAGVAALVLALVYAAVIGGIYLGCLWLAPGGEVAFRSFVRGSGYSDNSVGNMLMVIVAFPVLEEFWFRGVMYTPMRKEFGKWPAIIFLAVIFAAMHYPGIKVPLNQLFGGLVFAWVYEKRRTLAAPVLLHMAGNGSLALITHLATVWGLR